MLGAAARHHDLRLVASFCAGSTQPVARDRCARPVDLYELIPHHP